MHIFQRMDEVFIRESIVRVLRKNESALGGNLVETLCTTGGILRPIARNFIVSIKFVYVLWKVGFLPWNRCSQDDSAAESFVGSDEV